MRYRKDANDPDSSNDWDSSSNSDSPGNNPLTLTQQQLVAALCVIALVVGILWLLQRPAASPPMAAGPTVRIATWNLRFFSTHRKSIPEPNFDAIAQIIRDSKFDVLAIQEVKGKGEAVSALMSALGEPYRAAALSPETGNGERFAFVYNSQHVRDLGDEHPIDLSEGLFERHPYQGSFQAGALRFSLVTCHIYYGTESAGHQRREREVEALANYARSLESHQRPVIVLGDFNEQHNSPNLYNFTDTGWHKLITTQTNLGGAHEPETFDNILLDQGDMAMFAGSSGSVPWDIALYHDDAGPVRQREAAEHEAANNISDHRPAYADLLTARP